MHTYFQLVKMANTSSLLNNWICWLPKWHTDICLVCLSWQCPTNVTQLETFWSCGQLLAHCFFFSLCNNLYTEIWLFIFNSQKTPNKYGGERPKRQEYPCISSVIVFRSSLRGSFSLPSDENDSFLSKLHVPPPNPQQLTESLPSSYPVEAIS